MSEILHIGKDSLPKYLDDKDIDTNDIGLIAAEFPEPDLLLSTLRERCPQLPHIVRYGYLTKRCKIRIGDKRIDGVEFISQK